MKGVIFEGDVKQLFAYFDTAIKCDIVKIRSGKFTYTVNMSLVKMTVQEGDVITFLFTDHSRLRVYRGGLIAYRRSERQPERRSRSKPVVAQSQSPDKREL